MVDQSLLLRSLADHARTLARPHGTSDILHRLARDVAGLLALQGVGVSLADAEGSLEVVSASDARSAELERHQRTVGSGPGLDAVRSRQQVVCHDLRTDPRWAGFRSAALDHGVQAVAAVALATDRDLVGAMCLYSRGPRTWSPDDLEVAEVLAALSTGEVLAVRRITAHERLAAQLQHALTSRVAIEQAKGLLAERHGIDPGAAFERLRRYARGHNQRVADVARAVLDDRLRL